MKRKKIEHNYTIDSLPVYEDPCHVLKAIDSLFEYMLSAALDDDFGKLHSKRGSKLKKRILIASKAIKELKKICES